MDTYERTFHGTYFLLNHIKKKKKKLFLPTQDLFLLFLNESLC